MAQALSISYQDDAEMVKDFATRYDLMTVDKTVYNPYSYVAFSQHRSYGRDTRFGAGKPNNEVAEEGQPPGKGDTEQGGKP